MAHACVVACVAMATLCWQLSRWLRPTNPSHSFNVRLHMQSHRSGQGRKITFHLVLVSVSAERFFFLCPLQNVRGPSAQPHGAIGIASCCHSIATLHSLLSKAAHTYVLCDESIMYLRGTNNSRSPRSRPHMGANSGVVRYATLCHDKDETIFCLKVHSSASV